MPYNSSREYYQHIRNLTNWVGKYITFVFGLVSYRIVTNFVKWNKRKEKRNKQKKKTREKTNKKNSNSKQEKITKTK